MSLEFPPLDSCPFCEFLAGTESVARLAKTMAEALELAFDPTGINVFQNNGRASGQTVPHYHVHVVPRYPTSDPGRLFRERDFPLLPEADLEGIAEKIRVCLVAPSRTER